MLAIMTGQPGSGKSYEAVVYHVLHSLQNGRKVVTNLPIRLDVIEAVNPDWLALLDIRKPAGRWLGDSVDDYGDTWRDAQGKGPLYVIDECHKSLSRQALTPPVLEWYVEHRHEGADVLLVTAALRSVCAEIKDLCDVYYKVRNNRSLGSDKSYIRKVHNGVRGECLSQQVRRYDPANFKFYKSHTKSNSSVTEAMAQDVQPIWKHWTFKFSAPMLVLGLFFSLKTCSAMLSPDSVSPDPEPAPVRIEQPAPVVHQFAQAQPAQPVEPPAPIPAPANIGHPFDKVQLHIAGYIQSATGFLYLLKASQNGAPVFDITTADLEIAGYEYEGQGPCSMSITFGDFHQYLTCDSPRVGMAPPVISKR